jgi:hypothetical protein
VLRAFRLTEGTLKADGYNDVGHGFVRSGFELQFLSYGGPGPVKFEAALISTAPHEDT